METSAYLERIGATLPTTTTPDALLGLQVCHLETVPFENLSIHLGEPIVLDADVLWQKIVDQRRGGFCYELNGAFAVLLRELGFQVTLLAARVYGENGELGPPFDHLALQVDLDEPWLVDVGFGRHAKHPLRMNRAEPQPDPEGEFAVRPTPAGDFDVFHNGKPVYLVETRPRELADFAATCWYQTTSPASHFTQRLTCSRATPNGRITLAGDRLIETKGDARTECTLLTETILPAYRTHFGIELDRIPVVRPPDPRLQR